jgi:uncharacterized cupredoxin-like copper-binding protein
MTPRRAAVSLGLGVVALLGAAAMVLAVAREPEPVRVDLAIHYSHFQPATIVVPAGRPVTFVIGNGDPIDHEWIVGDAQVHQRHRTGTEPVHASRPTEVSIDAGATRTTTVTFTTPAVLTYVCHLPGHEAYGMTGTLIVTR